MTSPISISYASLLTPTPQLTAQLRAAFSSSPTSLGLLLITDVPPTFPALRLRLLLIANQFASLPEPTRAQYEDAGSSFSFGWSWGKEVMNGKRDTMKGSYYANPLSAALTQVGGGGMGQERNIWPREEDCEGFRDAFEQLCEVMLEVSERLARACDGYMREEGVGENGKGVERLLRESWGHKARLLHYFPPEGQILSVPSATPSQPFTSSVSSIDDSWCGTHIDHSLLTALCPSIYLFHPTDSSGSLLPLDPLLIPCPSPSTGLYVKTRGGEIIKAVIPENAIAFQTGETLSLLSNDTLVATPHFVHVDQTATGLSEGAARVVRAKIEEDERWKEVVGGRVSRETLAVFLQPNDEEVIGGDGETFGEFTTRVLTRHY